MSMLKVSRVHIVPVGGKMSYCGAPLWSINFWYEVGEPNRWPEPPCYQCVAAATSTRAEGTND